MKYTHSIVIEKLESIEKSNTLEEAKENALHLQGGPLSEGFRASGLCDIFVGHGISLRRIVELPPHMNLPDDEAPISEDEKFRWIQFCDSLEDREQQVAGLYSEQIEEINKLAWGLQDQDDLNEIKAYASSAKRILTDQMADFDSLSLSFRNQLK